LLDAPTSAGSYRWQRIELSVGRTFGARDGQHDRLFPISAPSARPDRALPRRFMQIKASDSCEEIVFMHRVSSMRKLTILVLLSALGVLVGCNSSSTGTTNPPTTHTFGDASTSLTALADSMAFALSGGNRSDSKTGTGASGNPYVFTFAAYFSSTFPYNTTPTLSPVPSPRLRVQVVQSTERSIHWWGCHSIHLH